MAASSQVLDRAASRAWARAAGALGFIKMPHWESTRLGIPPTSLATTGRPQARASKITLGEPSDSLGRQKTLQAASHLAIWGGLLAPINRTTSVSPLRRTVRVSLARQGPSPIQTICRLG